MPLRTELRRFFVDLHLHTVLSPCADLGMGAPEIVARCRDEGIALVAVTDHNHTGNFPALRDAAGDRGPLFLPGMEVQSMEDIHIVVIFRDVSAADAFEQWLWRRMPPVQNRENIFGHQLIVDAENNIVREEPTLLIQGAGYTVDEIAARGTEVGGIVIPAHLDRPGFSYETVLGRLPDSFPCAAVEISPRASHADLECWKRRYPARTIVRAGDAHRIEEISRSRCSLMLLAEPSFNELLLALRGEEGRRTLFP